MLTTATVTEDYSEYESVDEEEPPKEKSEVKKKAPPKELSRKGTLGPSDGKKKAGGASKGGQQSLASFFGKK